MFTLPVLGGKVTSKQECTSPSKWKWKQRRGDHVCDRQLRHSGHRDLESVSERQAGGLREHRASDSVSVRVAGAAGGRFRGSSGDKGAWRLECLYVLARCI